jgi:hypothetical protein
VEHVKAYVGGPTSYIDEDIDTSSNAARNIAFELLLMAKLTSATIPMDFRIKSDVAVHFDNRSLLFECKRPQSVGSLENNVKKALRQFKTKYRAPQRRRRHRGIIAIDITKLVNPEFMLYAQDDEQTLDAGLSGMVDCFISTHERLWQKQRDRKTIAVLLRVSLMGVNKARNEMLTYCQQYALTPLNHVGARNIETVRALTQAMRGALDYAV